MKYLLKCAKHEIKKINKSRAFAILWPFDVFSLHDDIETGLKAMKKQFGHYVHIIEMHTAHKKTKTNNVDWWKGRPSKVIYVLKNAAYKHIKLKCKQLDIKLES